MLILIFLFNLGGYRLWFYYVQQQSDTQFEASVDSEQYNRADLITLKIPISLPYQTNWKEFESADGEINYNGKIYKYVKRKVYNGELVLLCLPDKNKMRIEKTRQDFFENSNNLTKETSKKSDNSKAGSFKNTLSEYTEHSLYFEANSLNNISQTFIPHTIGNLLSTPHISPWQPPDVVLS